jgi:virulence-associated protein VagC
MATAKLFQHGGSQALRLPKEFRFEGTEVEIERRGREVILRTKPKPRLETSRMSRGSCRRTSPTLATSRTASEIRHDDGRRLSPRD